MSARVIARVARAMGKIKARSRDRLVVDVISPLFFFLYEHVALEYKSEKPIRLPGDLYVPISRDFSIISSGKIYCLRGGASSFFRIYI